MEKIVHQGWLIKSPPEKVTPFLNAVTNTIMNLRPKRNAFRLGRYHFGFSTCCIKKWKERYFVLKQLPGGRAVLEYFTDRSMSKAKGSIDLTECTQVDAGIQIKSARKSYQHIFDIQTQDKIHYLVANSEADMNEWVEYICSLCGLKMYSDPPQDVMGSAPSTQSTDDGSMMAHGYSTTTLLDPTSVASFDLITGSALLMSSGNPHLNAIRQSDSAVRYSPLPSSNSMQSLSDNHQQHNANLHHFNPPPNPSMNHASIMGLISSHSNAYNSNQSHFISSSSSSSPATTVINVAPVHYNTPLPPLPPQHHHQQHQQHPPTVAQSYFLTQEMSLPNEMLPNQAHQIISNIANGTKPVPNMNNNTIINYSTIVSNSSASPNASANIATNSESQAIMNATPPPPTTSQASGSGSSSAAGKSGPYIHISDCHTGRPVADSGLEGNVQTCNETINVDNKPLLSKPVPPPIVNRELKPQRRSKEIDAAQVQPTASQPNPKSSENLNLVSPLQLQPPPAVIQRQCASSNSTNMRPDEHYDFPTLGVNSAVSLTARRTEKAKRNVIAADELYDIPRTGSEQEASSNSRPSSAAADSDILNKSVPLPADDGYGKTKGTGSNGKHAYTNAPAGFMSNKDQVFVYDYKPSLPTTIVPLSNSISDENETSPGGTELALSGTPPRVNRELKPRKRFGTTSEEDTTLMSSNSSLTLHPSSPSYYHDQAKSGLTLTSNNPFSRIPSVPNKVRQRPNHNHQRASSYSEDQTNARAQQQYATMALKNRKPPRLPEIQYLDLDLDSDSKDSTSPRSPADVPSGSYLTSEGVVTLMNTSPPAPTGRPISQGGGHYSNAPPPTTTVYKTVDFVKTKAFNEMRNERTAQKQQAQLS